jgi:hypothetical protein
VQAKFLEIFCMRTTSPSAQILLLSKKAVTVSKNVILKAFLPSPCPGRKLVSEAGMLLLG